MFVNNLMRVIKRNNGSFSSHVVHICRENVFHRYIATLLVCVQAHLKLWGRTMQLFHSLDPTVTPYIQDTHWLQMDKSNCFQWEQRLTARNDRHIQDTARLSWKLTKIWQNQNYRTWGIIKNEWNRVTVFGSVFVPASRGPMTNSGDCKKYPCILHSNYFIFPIKQPLCLSVSSAHSALQWRDADRLSCLNGFSRAAEGEHNNR